MTSQRTGCKFKGTQWLSFYLIVSEKRLPPPAPVRSLSPVRFRATKHSPLLATPTPPTTVLPARPVPSGKWVLVHTRRPARPFPATPCWPPAILVLWSTLALEPKTCLSRIPQNVACGSTARRCISPTAHLLAEQASTSTARPPRLQWQALTPSSCTTPQQAATRRPQSLRLRCKVQPAQRAPQAQQALPAQQVQPAQPEAPDPQVPPVQLDPLDPLAPLDPQGWVLQG